MVATNENCVEGAVMIRQVVTMSIDDKMVYSHVHEYI